jgi:hypothetical protein
MVMQQHGIVETSSHKRYCNSLPCKRINDKFTEAFGQTVVEGAWRGGFERQEEELSVSKARSEWLKRQGQILLDAIFIQKSEQGSLINFLVDCVHADYDWLYKYEGTSTFRIKISCWRMQQCGQGLVNLFDCRSRRCRVRW